jgi:hypothetical protein
VNIYAVAADGVLVLHLGYIAFTVGGFVLIVVGGLVGWNWVRNAAFRIIHIVAVALVAVEAMVGVLCPLTQWEYALRDRAGQQTTEQLSLVARIVQRIIFYEFPDWVFLVVYVTFTVAVLGLFYSRFGSTPPKNRKPDWISFFRMMKFPCIIIYIYSETKGVSSAGIGEGYPSCGR